MLKLSSILSGGMSWLSKWIPLKPVRAQNWLVYCTALITVIIGGLKLGEAPAVMVFLTSLHNDFARYLFYAVCILLALLPSCFAQCEGSTASQSGYVAGNRVFNLIGIGCLIFAMETMYRTIQNTIFLTMLCSVEIVQGLIPLCLWIALSYQYQEQQKAAELDYSPSLKWKSQIFNVLHLINTYFWSFFAGILLICYTLYCYIHHIPITLTVWHLLAFSVILIFFYAVAAHTHTYLYLLFLAAVPAILIYGIQWQSWFVLEPIMFYVRALLFVGHYIVYSYFVYTKEPSKSKAALIAAGLSAACIFCCCISPMPEWLKLVHILVLSIILIAIGVPSVFWGNLTSYQLTLILVPAYLICIVNWTSSIVTTQHMAYLQAGFVIVHLTLYMLVIFCYIRPHAPKIQWRTAITFLSNKLTNLFGKYMDDPSGTEDEVKEELAKKLILGDYFFVVVFAVMVFAYPVFCTLPFTLEQMDYNIAVKYINAICDDQRQAEELLSDIRNSSWYTDDPMLELPEIDQTQYLIFMYSCLRDEMVQKGVISSSDKKVTDGQLLVWYIKHSVPSAP